MNIKQYPLQSLEVTIVVRINHIVTLYILSQPTYSYSVGNNSQLDVASNNAAVNKKHQLEP